MRRPRPLVRSWGLRLLAATVLLAYPAAAFYPYRWDPPRAASNTAEAMPEGGVRFAAPGPGIARSRQPPAWIAAVRCEHRFELDLSVRSASSDQIGPARILTLSRDPYLRNFTLGQQGADLIVRIRTPWHSRNGMPNILVPGVFATPSWVDLRIGVAPGELRVTVDGQVRLRQGLPQAPLKDWDPSYRLALGNELTGDRAWLGEVRRAVLDAGGERTDYAAPGALQFPPRLWFFHMPAQLAPFSDLKVSDVLVNVLGFVPLGLLAGAWARRRPGHIRWWLGLAAVLAVSLALELLQLCFLFRYPSVNDLIFNTLGGTLGVLAAAWLGRGRPPGAAPRSVDG